MAGGRICRIVVPPAQSLGLKGAIEPYGFGISNPSSGKYAVGLGSAVVLSAYLAG